MSKIISIILSIIICVTSLPPEALALRPVTYRNSITRREFFKKAAKGAAVIGASLFLPKLSSSEQASRQIGDVSIIERILSTEAHSTLEQVYVLLKQARGSTGLVESFFKSKDMSKQGFTYDQALFGLTALLMRDFKAADAIKDTADRVFDFYYNKYLESQIIGLGFYGFANTYDIDAGIPGIEGVASTGPNAWIGLFSLYYFMKTGDERGLELAKTIYYWIKGLNHEFGGVAMGEFGDDANIFSTENNLSYYGFLNNLLPYLSGNEAKEASGEISGIKNWLKDVAFDRRAYLFNRGLNDFVRALDTSTFAMLALGGEILESKYWSINLSDFIKTTEENFSVDNRGFDATNENGAGSRGMLVFGEFTLQMAAAYSEVAKYERRRGNTSKAKEYEEKARHYYNAIDNYNYCEKTGVRVFFDIPTWITVSGRSASVLAWKIFALRGFNPLSVPKPVRISEIKLKVGRTVIVIERNNPWVPEVDIEYTDDLTKRWNFAESITLADDITEWEDDGTHTGGLPANQRQRFYRVKPYISGHPLESGLVVLSAAFWPKDELKATLSSSREPQTEKIMVIVPEERSRPPEPVPVIIKDSTQKIIDSSA